MKCKAYAGIGAKSISYASKSAYVGVCDRCRTRDKCSSKNNFFHFYHPKEALEKSSFSQPTKSNNS
ncbi:hypothetical protein PS710_00699 [Pseudomonas fluorescens]|uniref:Uncharacterized protein n=1 Tax=Pseudomonas fluorescens TaxID=294 RepID=A0A5E7A8F3_PSEFL|nr:hypothetical protein PS710_00699 [Pseudomonas fluorescens]